MQPCHPSLSLTHFTLSLSHSLTLSHSLALSLRRIGQNRVSRLEQILPVFQNCVNLATFEYAQSLT
jgi:hypothetical protein